VWRPLVVIGSFFCRSSNKLLSARSIRLVSVSFGPASSTRQPEPDRAPSTVRSGVSDRIRCNSKTSQKVARIFRPKAALGLKPSLLMIHSRMGAHHHPFASNRMTHHHHPSTSIRVADYPSMMQSLTCTWMMRGSSRSGGNRKSKKCRDQDNTHIFQSPLWLLDHLLLIRQHECRLNARPEGGTKVE
jgi:hypothetical protein